MKSQLLNLTYEIELQPGETFVFPDDWKPSLGAGRWKITIEPVPNQEPDATDPRDHSAFLTSYVDEDEGLYDHLGG